MECTGQVTIGGTVFGAVEADMETADGVKYHFVGYYADAGVGVGKCPSASGDFPGLDHIIGGCMMEVAQAPGGAIVNFHDLHGQIGSLGGVFEGAVVQVGFGGGTWSYADSAGQRLEDDLERGASAPKPLPADYADSAK